MDQCVPHYHSLQVSQVYILCIPLSYSTVFCGIGVEYEKYNNPADFYIDSIIKNESSMDGVGASDEDIITMKSK